MSSRWFRLYDEMLDDHKVQTLSPDLFKAWINLLAVACRNDGFLPPVEKLAFALRVSAHEMQSRLDDLILVGLLDVRPDKKIEPHNWSERQFVSDSSKERTRKYRERLNKKSCDVTVTPEVTPPEAEAESEADTESSLSTRETFVSRFGLGKASRGVPPRLRAKVEGLGLPVDDLIARAMAPDVKSPSALFRHLAVESLHRMLPRADKRMLASALTKDGDQTYGIVCKMILEAAQ